MTNSELLHINIETLFRCTDTWRLLCVNEPGDRPPPRFYAGLADGCQELRFGAGVSAAMEAELRALAGAGAYAWPTRGQLPPWFEGVLAVLGPAAPAGAVYHGPAYRFPDAIVVQGDATPLPEGTAALFHPHLASWAAELSYRQPAFGVVRDGVVVAICASSRNAERSAAAGVETVAAYRGQGLAPMAVAAWGRAVREGGRIPFYGTTWGNAASQAVAAKLGLVMFGEDLHVG